MSWSGVNVALVLVALVQEGEEQKSLVRASSRKALQVMAENPDFDLRAT